MAQAFNLTAQIQVQANQSNINQTVNRIKKQLQPIGNVNLKVNTNAQALAKASKNVQGLSKGLQQSQKNASNLNKTLAESARRFSVITVATGTLLSFVNAFKKSVRSAIEFETELIKISQVTGRTTGQLKGLTDEVTKLSTSLGVSSSDLLNTSRILLQTGLSADKATKALEILAKTTLAATFDDIQSTTEGAIAILNQFGRQAAATGNDIKFLEQSLDAINAVSKNFAVESGDLVSAIRRVGGVFSNAGGSVEELVALFTSVRATTRESAETIATGLRTIFTRIQRAETVDQLKQLGIQLQDAQGNFVGAFEAVKRLSIVWT
jgi:TP901 family phage tail tape measure protein